MAVNHPVGSSSLSRGAIRHDQRASIKMEALFFCSWPPAKVSKIGDKYWSCIFTYRKDKIRIISVRRSRKEEIEIYES